MLALDEEALREWATDHSLEGLDVPQLLVHQELRAELQAAVDGANASVSRAESIREFASPSPRPDDRGR